MDTIYDILYDKICNFSQGGRWHNSNKLCHNWYTHKQHTTILWYCIYSDFKLHNNGDDLMILASYNNVHNKCYAN